MLDLHSTKQQSPEELTACAIFTSLALPAGTTVGAYGGSDLDIKNFLLMTNAVRGIFIDRQFIRPDYDDVGTPFKALRLERFDKQLATWGASGVEYPHYFYSRPFAELHQLGVKRETRKALHDQYTPDGQSILDFLWRHYDFSKSADVLEVGGGSGFMPHWLMNSRG